jgi:hypothetical protein
VTQYQNAITFIMGKHQTGKSKILASHINLASQNTVIDVLVGNAEEKENLVGQLPPSFPADTIKLNAPTFKRSEGATHLLIETGASQAKFFSLRDVVFYVTYAKEFLAEGYEHVTLTVDIGEDFSFSLTNFPEIKTIITMATDDLTGLYYTHVERIALVALVEEPAKVLEGVIVD